MLETGSASRLFTCTGCGCCKRQEKKTDSFNRAHGGLGSLDYFRGSMLRLPVASTCEVPGERVFEGSCSWQRYRARFSSC